MRKRRLLDELLPNGESVYEAVRRIAPRIDDLVYRGDEPQAQPLGDLPPIQTRPRIVDEVQTLGDNPEIQGINPSVPVTMETAPSLPTIAESPVIQTPVQPNVRQQVETYDLPPISKSQEYLNQINAINSKDYSIKKVPVMDESGQVVRTDVIRGKDRKQNWGLGDKLAGIAVGGGTGFLKGGVLGALIGALQGGTDRNYMRKFADSQSLPRITQKYNQAVQGEQNQANQEYNQARTNNVYADNEYQNKRLAEMEQDRLRKVDDRVSRERTARMNQVAGMFKNIPEYDPADPRFAELTKALGDVNLPITPKDAKKKVDLKQDQRTGEWTVILTNPLDGKQEVRPVMKDGQVFKSTPTVVMQGEYGLLKQNDQQEFTRTENEKDRVLRLKTQEIDQKFRSEQANLEREERAARDAKTAEEKIAAEQRAEASRKRILDYQNELQLARDEYKKNQ